MSSYPGIKEHQIAGESLYNLMEKAIDQTNAERLLIGRTIDREITTLSTAAIGFCFAYLPYSESFVCKNLYQVSIIFFFISIVLTYIGYLVITKHYTEAIEQAGKRRGAAQQLLQASTDHEYRFKHIVDNDKRIELLEEYDSRFKIIFEKMKSLSEPIPKNINLAGTINNWIGYVRSATFLIALLSLVIYVLQNLTLISSLRLEG